MACWRRQARREAIEIGWDVRSRSMNPRHLRLRNVAAAALPVMATISSAHDFRDFRREPIQIASPIGKAERVVSACIEPWLDFGDKIRNEAPGHCRPRDA